MSLYHIWKIPKNATVTETEIMPHARLIQGTVLD